MTYIVTPGTLKATHAKRWGEEMLRALRTRNISLNELERAVGHGHTAIDHYRRGHILPRTETAIAIATVLDWPKLRTMIEEYRTYTCARSDCGRTFRNDGGGPKRYCSMICRDIAENVRLAERRRRQAGQTDSKRLRTAADRRMKAVISTIQGELAVMHEYVDAMCASCEPEGLCRTLDCPLRPVSPLPYHEAVAEPVTDTERRRRAWTPARRERFAEALHQRWAEPGAREAQSARSKALHAARTPAEHEAWVARITASKAVHSTRNGRTQV